MYKKAMVIGANGALGTDLVHVLENSVPATRDDFDILAYDRAREVIRKSGVGTVINTAAFHQVPLCETEYAKAFEVNVIGVRNLAQICAELGVHLCHISTDYVFDGGKRKPYSETDLPRPESIYAMSKLNGEYAVQAYGRDYSIVRSCGLYGEVVTRGKGSNFVTNMIKFGTTKETVKVVTDEIVCPTYTHDLARGIGALLAADGKGLFHITQAGETSWHGFAEVIFDFLDLPAKLETTTADQFPQNVKRPAYSILDNTKFEKLTGFRMPHWKDALLRHLTRIQEKAERSAR